MTWATVADRYDVALCGECDLGPVAHRIGITVGRTVHWSDRRITRAGLRKFLILIARARLLYYWGLERWDQVYRENLWAQRAAEDMGLRLPKPLSLHDRALVRWLIRDKNVPPTVRRWADGR